MRAEDLRLDELIDFAEGRLSLHGRRVALHDLHAFAQLRKDLVQMIGVEHARRILTRLGYFWGEADAAAMNDIFHWQDLTEWLKAGHRMLGLQGIARTQIQSLELTMPDAESTVHHLEMKVLWHNSSEAEEHLTEFGPADHAVCWMLAGHASGYASYCLQQPIFFIEQQCRAQGDLVCTAIGKDAAAWGNQIEPYRQYFQTQDIDDKIRRLTQEIRHQTHDINRQRQQLSSLKARANSPFVEVRSPAFERVVELASRIAPHDSSVLITGESGVGKEVLARYIHRLSRQASGPFMAVNCGALPETLLESELFGYCKGAFTGAVRDHPGLFAEANKGTIFLDEIGDISHAMQVKLLRVLQSKEIQRIGDARPRKVDVRVITATNRNLAEAIAAGRFREDLFYRLAVIEITVPPLRDRSEDILPLARHFVEHFARKNNRPRLRLDATCLNYLQNYPWPGNVRELENAIERGVVLCSEDLIRPEHLPPTVVQANQIGHSAASSPHRTLEQVERDHIQAVLRTCGNNKRLAATRLGISPATLWRRLKSPSYRTEPESK